MMEPKKYQDLLKEVREAIPEEEYKEIFKQLECEYESDFLGFLEVYDKVRREASKDKIIIDLGCYLAAQSYLFTDYAGYIGIDTETMRRFTPPNATHYVGRIQQWIAEELPVLLQEHSMDDLFAVCSYVPDAGAREMVRKVFPNVICYYPGEVRFPVQTDHYQASGPDGEEYAFEIIPEYKKQK